MVSEHFPLRVPPEQKLLLTKACEDLEQETQEREEEKGRYLGEKIPPLQVSGMSMEELQVEARGEGGPLELPPHPLSSRLLRTCASSSTPRSRWWTRNDTTASPK